MDFLSILSYIFTINFNDTYKLGKHVHLTASHNEVLVKTKTSISLFFTCYDFIIKYSQQLQFYTKYFETNL